VTELWCWTCTCAFALLTMVERRQSYDQSIND
jgi:hypothetical protein